jgi:hypothetical protein
MRTFLIAAATAALSLSAADAAQAQIATRTGQVVGELRESDLEWLATQGGHRITGRRSDMQIDVDTAEGFKFSLQGEACSGEGKAMRCEGLALFASWTLEPGDVGKVTPVITAFNREYPAAKVFMWEGSAAMERYAIVTGGVTIEQLVTELNVFLILADAFWVEIDKATAK